MEVNVIYYRNIKTGKVYMQVGGQNESIEIDEEFAKGLNESMIIEYDPDTKIEVKTVICPACGSPVPKSAFCSVCGNPLPQDPQNA